MEPDASQWRGFFSLTGGSILYCLSAMSVIYGIANLLGPILGHAQSIREAYPCLGALNLYEIALLGALVFLVVKENVTDDAISLVILVALFLAGTGLTLSTVADQGYRTAFGIGLACFALGIGKLYSLRRLVGMRINAVSFAGLALVLAWNFGAGAFLARANDLGGAGRIHWMQGWLALLAGGLVLAAGAVRTCNEATQAGEAPAPFLRRPSMLLVFAIIVLAAAGVHQYALGYIFDVRRAFGDYLPLVSLLMYFVLRLSIGARSSVDGVDAATAAVPLAAVLYAVLSRSVVASPLAPVEYLWNPPLLLGLTGAAVFRFWQRHRSPALLGVCIAYASGVILTFGYDPANPYALHWHAMVFLVASGMLLAGLVRREATLCIFAVILATLGVASLDVFTALTFKWHLSVPGAVVGIAGLGVLLVSLVLGPDMHRAVGITASLGVAAGFIDAMTQHPTSADIYASAILLVLGSAVWLRTRQWPPTLILLAPIAARLWLVFTRLTAWRFVILGFVLLFAGTWFRVIKSRRARGATNGPPDQYGSP